ncbi:hypothetical protein PIB30_078229 [Stylosanthes scabra]|uniref:Uncharacterized protein n=1 Tax=Stylosanthes scabra TaxID=79078 RepID=A0ABU6WP38_9FABA|nr:hypothetical protein [Stylosanthes scabra]
MEEAYSYNQGYTPWNPPPFQHHTPRDDAYQSNGYGDAYYGYEDPPPPYLASQIVIKEAIQLLCLERKELLGNQRPSFSITVKSMEKHSYFVSMRQPRRKGGHTTFSTTVKSMEKHSYFVSIRQPRRKEDALLNEEDAESLDHKEVHECLEEVEEENEDQEVEDIDKEVKDKDKEPKGMKIVHFASSEATPPNLPSELHFEWVNPSNINFISPQHYGLLETDGQLRALCGVLDTKGIDSLVLDEARFITCGKSDFKAYSGHLHKLHNHRAKVRALSMRKHLGPWKFQKKLAKFGAKVAKKSARNEKITKKSLKAKSRAYAYTPKKHMRTHCHDLGRHVLAGTGPYAYAPERPMRHQWPDLCL